MTNHTLSDVELIAKKQKEITHTKLVQAGLVIVIALLSVALVLVILFARISPPRSTSTIDVITRASSTCEDGEKAEICVPDTITMGEPFVYTTKGEKLVDNFASVELQIVCKVKDGEFVSSIATIPYSHLPNGEFDIRRSTSVPEVSRIQSSDDCVMQSIASYTFYSENNGNEIPFTVKEVGTSNHFKLIVPEDVSVTPTTVIAQVPQPPSTPAPATPQVDNQPDPVPIPEQVQPDPQSCNLQRLPLIGGLLCQVL